jgi:hypothetical protein
LETFAAHYPCYSGLHTPTPERNLPHVWSDLVAF